MFLKSQKSDFYYLYTEVEEDEGALSQPVPSVLCPPGHVRMLYTELLQLWDEAVQAVDVRDWPCALAKLEQIAEPTSRTLFNAASAHLALGHLDPALKVSGPGCSQTGFPI